MLALWRSLRALIDGSVTNPMSDVTSSSFDTYTIWLQKHLLLSSLAVVALSYIALCRVSRYRLRNTLTAPYHGKTLAIMTDNGAQVILNALNEMEFPAMYNYSLQLALLRTYGIPSISKLLRATTQLSAISTVGKRFVDTTSLATELYVNVPNSERGQRAFARLNFLHGHYIKKGLISNDDMLYTLALFMNHPVEFINRYEWRQLSKVEVCALGLFHYSMGRAMEIDFSVLPGSKTGYRDGLQFYAELDQWAKAYEAECMIPDKKNREVAVKTSDFLKSTYPKFLHASIDAVVVAVADERLQEAILFPKRGRIAPVMLHTLVSVRNFVMKNLVLPRPEFMRAKLIASEDNGGGKRNFVNYEGLPYYVAPTWWNRYGPSTWSRRLMGLPLPGDPGMIPEGYLIDDLGPDFFRGKGKAEIAENLSKLRKERTGGCPFAVSR